MNTSGNLVNLVCGSIPLPSNDIKIIHLYLQIFETFNKYDISLTARCEPVSSWIFLCPRHFKWCGGGGIQYHPLSLRTYFSHVRPVQNDFLSISFEKNTVLDSYFIPRYMIIKCRSSLILGKIPLLL